MDVINRTRYTPDDLRRELARTLLAAQEYAVRLRLTTETQDEWNQIGDVLACINNAQQSLRGEE